MDTAPAPVGIGLDPADARRLKWETKMDGTRPLGAWERLLSGCGFRTHALPMSEGTPFVNVLLRAELA